MRERGREKGGRLMWGDTERSRPQGVANEPVSGERCVSGCMHVLTELKNLFLKQLSLWKSLTYFKVGDTNMYVMMTLRGKDTNVGENVGKYNTEETECIIISYYTV